VAHIATLPEEPFVSFERGIDREDPRSDIAKGGYDDASNILLRCLPQGGTHVCSIRADLSLDSVRFADLDGNTVFVAPFTFSTYVANVLTFSTHLIITTNTGAVWRYDIGAPGTLTIVRRGFNNTANEMYWTHTVFDQWLITLNGRDAPMKYGQHFLAQGEARPFMFPLGSKPVSPVGATITDENWTGGTFVADASVPGGGSRVHTQSLQVAASSNAFNSWTVAKNFLSGPYPYGGTDFTGTDFLNFQVFKAAGTANVRIRFGDDANANYFEFTQSVGPSASWQQFSLLRSSATTTGTPVWSDIKRVTFFNDDGANVVYFDDLYFLYANAPPALQVATWHKTRIVGGGAPTAGSTTPTLANLYWSRALFPDEFPPENATTISGGVNALSQANRITAVRELGSGVIVGTPSSISSFTLDAAGNPIVLMVTNEHGIDSHKSMVETPDGALLFFWQRGIYVIRATWRAYGSGKIANLLSDLWLIEPWWTQGVFDEKTQTIRFWFRQKPGSPSKVNTGVIEDFVRSQELGEGVWTSTMTQVADFAVPAIINGEREVIYVRFDGKDVIRMGVGSQNPANPFDGVQSSVQLPWMAREGKDKLTKWLGLIVPYATFGHEDNELTVSIRYAQHPHQFDSATYEDIMDLPVDAPAASQARVLFGRVSRWAQVKFSGSGFEVFPPVEIIALPTKRVP
jgi:hypothetical protein